MSDEVLSAERIAYQATTHECGWAEHHINALVESKVAEALTQAQESLAAARAQALEFAAQLSDSFAREICMGAPSGDLRHMQAVGAAEVSERIRALITPSDSTALAKLLAEERFPFAERLKSIANLAHKAWTDKKNIPWLFEKIEQIAIEGEFQAARVAELKGEQPKP